MRLPTWLAQHLAALRALLVFTVLLGLAYPLALVAAGRLPGLSHRADGSLTRVDGRTVGSSLIGQSFTDAGGNPVARYFQSRPSAAGAGYDPTASGASTAKSPRLSNRAAIAPASVIAARARNQYPSSGNFPVGRVNAPAAASRLRIPYPSQKELHMPCIAVAMPSRAR